MTIKCVSFYTNDAYYQASLKLDASLTKYGVTHEISKVEKATWAEAVMHKPAFVLQALESEGNYDGILWTDADSILCRKPDFSVFDACDLAFCYWQRSVHHEEEILTGTFFVRKDRSGIEFCKAWAEFTPKYQHHFTPEQASLKEVLALKEFKDLRIKRLPVEFVFIADDMREMYPDAQPYFEHYQLSRTERKA